MSLRKEIEAWKGAFRTQGFTAANLLNLYSLLDRAAELSSEPAAPMQYERESPHWCDICDCWAGSAAKHAEWHRSLARKPSLYVGTFMGAYRLDLTAEDGSEIPEHVRKVTTDWALRKEWPGVFKTPPPAPAPTRDGKEERRTHSEERASYADGSRRFRVHGSWINERRRA